MAEQQLQTVRTHFIPSCRTLRSVLCENVKRLSVIILNILTYFPIIHSQDYVNMFYLSIKMMSYYFGILTFVAIMTY